MDRTRLTQTLLIPLIVLLVAVSASCGDDADDASSDGRAETTIGGPGDGAAVDVVAVDYGYEGLPEQIEVGATLHLRNASAREAHELVAVALPAGEQRSVEDILALPEDELGALFAGEPAMVLIAPPQADGFAVIGDGMLTERGRYLLFCAIPTGADPEEFLAAAQEAQDGPPDVEGGPPHFTQGMYAELRVA
jgi:hypothetical protein